MRSFSKKIGLLLAGVAFLLVSASVQALDARMQMEAWLSPDVASTQTQTNYGWSLKNDSPYDIRGVYVKLDDAVISYIDKLDSGGSVSGEGVLLLEKEQIGRSFLFSAAGSAEIPDPTSEKSKTKITMLVSASSTAMAADPGKATRSYIPALPSFALAQNENIEGKSKLFAAAYLKSMVVNPNEESTLYVAVKNEGKATISQLSLMLGKETADSLESLEPGRNATMKYTTALEKATTFSPVLTYVDENGKKQKKKLGNIKGYVSDSALSVSARTSEENPNPKDEITISIEIKNTGERTISNLKLFDMQGNPVSLSAKKLKAGESMTLRCKANISSARELSYTAVGKGKTTVAAASESILIEPEIPSETIGLKLLVLPSKTELSGNGSDMVVFTCTAVNGGSSDLSSFCLYQDGKLIGTANILPAGERQNYMIALKLTASAVPEFYACAADETGKVHECKVSVPITEGARFPKR